MQHRKQGENQTSSTAFHVVSSSPQPGTTSPSATSFPSTSSVPSSSTSTLMSSFGTEDKITRRNIVVGSIVIMIIIVLFVFEHSSEQQQEVLSSSSSSLTSAEAREAARLETVAKRKKNKQQSSGDATNHDDDDEDDRHIIRHGSSPVRGVPFLPNRKAAAIFGARKRDGVSGRRRNSNNNVKKQEDENEPVLTPTPPQRETEKVPEGSGSSSSTDREVVIKKKTTATTESPPTEEEQHEQETTTTKKQHAIITTEAAAENDNDETTATSLSVVAPSTSTPTSTSVPIVVPTGAVGPAVSCYDWFVLCGFRGYVGIHVQDKSSQNPGCSYRSRIGRKVDLSRYGFRRIQTDAEQKVQEANLGPGCVLPLMEPVLHPQDAAAQQLYYNDTNKIKNRNKKKNKKMHETTKKKDDDNEEDDDTKTSLAVTTTMNPHQYHSADISPVSAATPYFLGDDIVRCFDISDKFPLVRNAQVIVWNPVPDGTLGGSKLACYASSDDIVCSHYAQSFKWEPQQANLVTVAAVQLRKFRYLQYLNFVRKLKERVFNITSSSSKKNKASSKNAEEPHPAKDDDNNKDSGSQHSTTSTTSEKKSSSASSSSSSSIPWSTPHFLGSIIDANDSYRPILQNHIDPNTITDDNYGVEFIDLGSHVGAMSSMLWRFGFPVKAFDAMHTNVNLLLATRCFNRLLTEFSQPAICKTQLSQEVSPKKMKSCLKKKVDLHNEDPAKREEELLNTACPVTEAVPFQITHAALSATSGETCAMFSDFRNVGDVIVSCDKNLTESAKHNKNVYIRDSWYSVRGLVKTRLLDEYIFATPEETCARTEEGTGGVRFQHSANRRKKEILNAVRGAFFDHHQYQQEEQASKTKKKNNKNTLHTPNPLLDYSFVEESDILLAKEYYKNKNKNDDKDNTEEEENNNNNNSEAVASSSHHHPIITDQFEAVAAARLNDDIWRRRRLARPTPFQSTLKQIADELFLGEISSSSLHHQENNNNNNNNGTTVATASSTETDTELDEEKLIEFEKSHHLEELQRELLDSQQFQHFATKDYIVKIDVEGHEGDLIKGADKWLSDPILRPKFLLIETWVHKDVTGFCKKMIGTYKYVGLSTRLWPLWVTTEDECKNYHDRLMFKDKHDDAAWMPLEWAAVLAPPEAVRSLETKLGKKLSGPSA